MARCEAPQLGERFIGRDTMRHGWTQYFAIVENYKAYVEEYFMREESVAMFGTASGAAVFTGLGLLFAAWAAALLVLGVRAVHEAIRMRSSNE